MQRLPAGYVALLPRSSSPGPQGQHATKPHPAALSLSSPETTPGIPGRKSATVGPGFYPLPWLGWRLGAVSDEKQ